MYICCYYFDICSLCKQSLWNCLYNSHLAARGVYRHLPYFNYQNCIVSHTVINCSCVNIGKYRLLVSVAFYFAPSPLEGCKVWGWVCLFVCLFICLSAHITQKQHSQTLPVLQMTYCFHTMGLMSRIKHDVMLRGVRRYQLHIRQI